MIEKFLEEKIIFFRRKGKYFYKKIKNQIEVEKIKLDLKKKYIELGQYVIKKKELKSMVDFSHDELYEHKINEIIKLKYYINNQKQLMLDD